METPEGHKGAGLPVPHAGMPRDAQRPQYTSGDLSMGGNLDKVRDILFGTQMRESDRKLSRLEEHLLKECADIKEDTRIRFEALEVFVKKELESLSERLKSEQNARHDAVRDFSQELKDVSKSFDKRFSQIEEQGTKAQRDLRQQILDQSRTLRDETWGKYRELSEAISRDIQELRLDKTDRASLAALLAEMAMQLNNQYMLPSSE